MQDVSFFLRHYYKYLYLCHKYTKKGAILCSFLNVFQFFLFQFANQLLGSDHFLLSKAIPFVALVGENEMNEGKVTLKNMETGEQKMVTPQELVSELK